jgi:hypothetical protein
MNLYSDHESLVESLAALRSAKRRDKAAISIKVCC